MTRLHRILTFTGPMFFALALFLATPASAKWIPTTRTNIDTNPHGATVYLVTPEGTETALGLTPLSRTRLPRGLITLRFRLEGYEDLVETVEIKTRILSFVFNMVREIKPSVLDFISDKEFEGATVTVDGKKEGALPTSVTVPPGRHQVVVTKDGYEEWERWIDTTEGQKVAFEVVMKTSAKAKGSILATSVPSGGEVRVNGAPRGTTPTVVDGVEPGDQLVEVFLDGYAPWQQKVTVGPGERAVVDARLETAGGGSGTLRVVTDVDGAMVWIDGEQAGPAPVTKADIPAGTHLVEARAEGYAKATGEAEVRRGETAVVRLSLADATRQATGTVRVVASVSGAMASIDGGPAQPVPLVRDDVSAGTHFVTVTAPGYAEWKKSVSVTPGGIVEVVADMGTAGRLEVDIRGKGPAEVFLDGKLLGPAPLKTDIATGTYHLTVKRADGKMEEHDIAIGTGSAVKITAKFDAAKVRHRAMPFSAQNIDKGFGTIDLGLSWPYIFVARVNGGVWRNMDIGVSFRSALDTINEVELRAKYQVARSRAFAFAGELGVGFGFGADSRNTFMTRLTTLSSILISEKVAATARVGFTVYTDRLGPKDEIGTEGRDGGIMFQAGLSLEARLSKHINFYLLFEGEPFTDHRKILDLGVFKDAKSLGIWVASGISVLF
ncbi:MAG: PEGA domain-containing protein [Deltaproteobacteria bacterium]|nr:PEGA domain-containing protein [Deltaproteobacteria bacterium]